MEKPAKLLERDANNLDRVRVKVDTRMELIIREQGQVIEAANKGIKKINADLKALKLRLEPYLKNKYGRYDDVYYGLKDRYTNKLAERSALERARTMAEESISAARLHTIPGEIDKNDW